MLSFVCVVEFLLHTSALQRLAATRDLLHTCRYAAHREGSDNLQSSGAEAQWESEVPQYVLHTMLLWWFSIHSIFSTHIYEDNIE
jgi:hypothetical protein